MVKPNMLLKLKESIDITKGIITILAIIIGGFWTYNIYVKERRHFPHANIEQTVEHISLSEKINLLHVTITLMNDGASRLFLKKGFVRIQQILPEPDCNGNQPCVPSQNQIEVSLKGNQRKQDRFSWPLIQERNKTFEIPLDIEPGEKDIIGFEFALSSSVKAIRVYSYFRNEAKSKPGSEIGWKTYQFYRFE